MALQIRKAAREHVFIKIGVAGPSGSGKTKGALALAHQLVPEGRVLVLDTENRSASLYADHYAFDVIDLEPPYESRFYVEAIDLAVREGYDVLVIDSLSHQWEGSGGILDRKTEEERNAKNANGFALWGKYKEEHRRFMARLLQAPLHIICCMRSKQEFVQTESRKIVKLGMAPITGENAEYEFSIVFDLSMGHKAEASKDRSELFDGRIVDLIADRPGEKIAAWLSGGAAAAPRAMPAAQPAKPVALVTDHATPGQLAQLDLLAIDERLKPETRAFLSNKLEARARITAEQAEKWIAQANAAFQAPAVPAATSAPSIAGQKLTPGKVQDALSPSPAEAAAQVATRRGKKQHVYGKDALRGMITTVLKKGRIPETEMTAAWELLETDPDVVELQQLLEQLRAIAAEGATPAEAEADEELAGLVAELQRQIEHPAIDKKDKLTWKKRIVEGSLMLVQVRQAVEAFRTTIAQHQATANTVTDDGDPLSF